MNIEDLQIHDWISLYWIGYKLYVVDITDKKIIVSSPAWFNTETMSFDKWRFDKPDKIKFLGKGRKNPFYNNITKHLKLIHPVIL